MLSKILSYPRQALAHPLMRGRNPVDPATTRLRRRIIDSKPLLRAVYEQWYDFVVEHIPAGNEPVLEVGAGPGYLGERVHDLITSDIALAAEVDCVCDACRLPVAQASLRSIVMVNVFHHLPSPGSFLTDAQSALRPGGTIVLVEPWITSWSLFVYRHLHQEGCDETAASWDLADLPDGMEENAALPWMVFARDRDTFAAAYPKLRIERTELIMPFSYLASGGVSLRSLAPGWTLGLWRKLDRLAGKRMERWAMFGCVVVRRLED